MLRVTEPDLPRPFRVPGGLTGAVLVGVLPIGLLAFACVRAGREVVLGMNSFIFAALMVLGGFAAYWIGSLFSRRLR